MCKYYYTLVYKTPCVQLFELTFFFPFFFLKIVIASIMCSYSKNDWMELSKMAEVMISFVYIYFISSLPFLLVLNKELP